ncbi:MAG: hypothetical protein KF887_05370 [Paracoccaceae bacterium]|nr:MAG: hypothetical protein KF887_05370 [Paracoccaceae bacterium]
MPAWLEFGAAVLILDLAIWLSATAIFSHANLAVPGWLDRVLRAGIVTPDGTAFTIRCTVLRMTAISALRFRSGTASSERIARPRRPDMTA